MSEQIKNLEGQTSLSKEDKNKLKDLRLRQKNLNISLNRFEKIKSDQNHTFKIRTTNNYTADLYV